MENPDHIARIYAFPYGNDLATAAIQKSRFSVNPPPAPSPTNIPSATTWFTIFSDDPTPPSGTPYIQISLERAPTTPLGITFGSDSLCDVVLTGYKGVSRHHCSITFDSKGRLIVRDLDSKSGTQVTYDGEGQGYRQGFHWIVGEGGGANKKTVIHIGPKLSFLVEVQNAGDTSNPSYLQKVERFRAGNSAGLQATTLLDAGLHVEARLASETIPPLSPIYLSKPLGQGSSGRAMYQWNVSTGEEIVIKEPIHGLFMDDARIEEWKREAKAMERLRHENICQLIKAEFDPKPRLFLEYCPGNSLRDLNEGLDILETVQVLQQSLAGLRYAHDMRIVHRDLKPANILVVSLSPLKIKLADFGLAKNEDCLNTFCGTPCFMAPEIWEKGYVLDNELVYTKAVDIWALGVVVFELMFGRITAEKPGIELCHRVYVALKLQMLRNPDCLKELVLKHMLQMDPDKRSSAAACYQEALNLPKINEWSGRRLWSGMSSPSSTLTMSSEVETPWGERPRNANSSLAQYEHLFSCAPTSLLGSQTTTSGLSRKRAADEPEDFSLESRRRKRLAVSTESSDAKSGWSFEEDTL